MTTWPWVPLFLAASAHYSLTVSPSVNTINPGQSATYTISVTPGGGFNHVVVFSCSGLPAGASCATTSSVTLDGTNASVPKLP